MVEKIVIKVGDKKIELTLERAIYTTTGYNPDFHSTLTGDK